MGWAQCDFAFPQAMLFESRRDGFIQAIGKVHPRFLIRALVGGQVCVKSERAPTTRFRGGRVVFSWVGRNASSVFPGSWCLKSHPDGLFQVVGQVRARFFISASFGGGFVPSR